MEDWELKAVNWHRLTITCSIRRDYEIDGRPLLEERQIYLDGTSSPYCSTSKQSDFKTIAAVISKVLRRWTLFSVNLMLKSLIVHLKINKIVQRCHFIWIVYQRMKFFSMPWLRRWREITNNWSNPELLNHEYNSLILRNGRLFLRVENDDGKIKLLTNSVGYSYHFCSNFCSIISSRNLNS